MRPSGATRRNRPALDRLLLPRGRLDRLQQREPRPGADERATIPAIEAWYADHGTYAGLTLEALRQQYDAGLPDVTIVGPLNMKAYCVEATADGVSYFFKAGPAADILEGHCGDAQ
jgi:hypothetical protein